MSVVPIAHEIRKSSRSKAHPWVQVANKLHRPKKDKYPFGYPGDEFGPNSVPHYECKVCKTIYPTGSEHGTACVKCGLFKTDESPRVLPRKVEPEPDPELLKQLQARLEGLKVA